MSLRDELQPVRIGIRSAIDTWLDEKPTEWRQEFTELIHDHSIGHTQLGKLAKNHGCPTALNTFADWRKRQWDSKTS